MVLTVTLNPLLEIRLNFNSGVSKKVNRNGKISYAAGGKGINVSRQLRALSVDSVAFTTASGMNGKRFTECLENDNLKPVILKTSGETRLATVINSSEGQLNFFSTDVALTSSERALVIEKLSRMIPTADTVAVCGSVPDPESGDIIRHILRLCADLDKLAVLDTYGENLRTYFEYPPVIMHNNVNEIADAFNINPESDEDIIRMISDLHSKGVKQIYLTNGSQPFYASNYGFIYRVTPAGVQEISSTGCGDAFTAGLIYTLHNHYKFEDGLRFAAALGSLEATKSDVCRNTLSEIEPYLDRVKIEPVGRRMNEFDVPRAN